MARPRKSLTDDQKAQIEVMAGFLSLDQIADFFCMSRTTLSEIMKRDKEVSERYKKGKASAVGAVAKSLVEQARGGNLTAAIFYLKTQAGWKEAMNEEAKTEELPQCIEVKVVRARKNDKPETE